MKAATPWLDVSIKKLLDQYPELLPLFIRYNTGCVGCPMAFFCSLQSAVEIHELEHTSFLAEVETLINSHRESSANTDAQ